MQRKTSHAHITSAAVMASFELDPTNKEHIKSTIGNRRDDSFRPNPQLVQKYTAQKRSYLNKLVIIHPNNPLKQYWDIWIMLLIIYTLITVPLTIGFGVSNDFYAGIENYYFNYDAINNFNAVSDWCFALDTTSVFMTSYVDELGHEVVDFKLVAWRYISSFFVIDLLSVIPFDLIIQAVVGTSSSSSSYTSLFKALKIPRLLRLSRIFKKFDELSIAILWRMFRLVFSVFIFVHIFTCVMGLVLVASNSFWMDALEIEIGRKWYSRYIACAHAVTGLLFGNTFGPTNLGEVAFSLFTILFGGAVQASIIGSVTALMASAAGDDTNFTNQMDVINSSIRTMNLDQAIADDIRKFFSFQHAIYGTSGEHNKFSWIEALSPSLQTQILKNKYYFLLVKVPFFQGTHKAFLEAILSKITTELFLPEEFVYKEGDMALQMYFVLRGVANEVKTVKEFGAQNIVIKTYKKGDFFGELGILRTKTNFREYDIETLTYSEYAILTSRDVFAVAADYADDMELLGIIAKFVDEVKEKKMPVNLKEACTESRFAQDWGRGHFNVLADPKRSKSVAKLAIRGSFDEEEEEEYMMNNPESPAAKKRNASKPPPPPPPPPPLKGKNQSSMELEDLDGTEETFAIQNEDDLFEDNKNVSKDVELSFQEKIKITLAKLIEEKLLTPEEVNMVEMFSKLGSIQGRRD